MQMAFTLFIFITFFVLISLTHGSQPHDKKSTAIKKKDEIGKRSGVFPNDNLDMKPQVRLRAVQAARTLQGSIYQGLRSDYLLSITLPWTLGMFAFVILLLVCMRSDGWLYHLFTDDYVPPAVKKRLEEEARRAAGKRARMEREDNWKQVKKSWEADLAEVTGRVKATMPPDFQPDQSTSKGT